MERIIFFTEEADEDLLFFKKSGQSQILKKIRELIEDIKKNPTTGLGKPELLKHELKGYWSRRLT